MFKNLYKFLLILEILIIIYLGYLIVKEMRFNKPLKDEIYIYKNYLERKLNENNKLKSRLEYLSDPENFKKELKEKLNLAESGESVIILPENFEE